jgi:hypothetical protein
VHSSGCMVRGVHCRITFIAQNIYLYYASTDPGCVVRGTVPDEKLTSEIGLRSNQRIILGKTVSVQ